MFNVSNSYREMIQSDCVRSRVSGTITLNDKTVVTIGESNIINGSLSINNKCVNNSDFCLGSVYVGQMSMTLFNSTIDRYSLYGAKVELSYFLTLEDGSEEEVPLGVFFVDKAVRSKKLIQLTCYDCMTSFDKEIQEDSWGTAFDLLTLACDRCGVELGNTQDELTAMCNGEALLSMDSTRISTYRDLIYCIASVLCGFATINRQGKLEIRQFHTVPDMSIKSRQRTSSTVHDYETYFKSVKARFVAESNYYPYTETDEEMETGLQLDMGDIPVIQGFDTFKHEVLQNILAELKKIRYVPSEITIVPDPSIDLGDGITLENVNGTTDSSFMIVTSFSWTNHKKQDVVSNGTDTLLKNVSDDSNKQLADMEAVIESKNLVVKTYTNSKELTVKGSDDIIIRMNWSAFENTTALFIATVPIEMSADGNLILTYYRSLTKVGSITKYLSRGKHFVTFTNYISSEADEAVGWIVRARTEFFESDVRKQEAKILSFKDWIDHQTITTTTNSGTGEVSSVFNYEYSEQAVDTTAPTGKILEQEIKAVAFAQGLNATEAWDGTLTLEDTVDIIPFTGFKIKDNLIESVVTTKQAPDRHDGITDSVRNIRFGGFRLQTVMDYFGSSKVVEQQTVQFKLNTYTEKTDGVLKLKTEYQYNSINETIDEGQMVSVQAMTSDKVSVESVVVSHG